MLDLKFVRENPDIVKQNIKNKFQDRKLPLVDEVIELDAKARAVKTEADELRANRNKLSKQIGTTWDLTRLLLLHLLPQEPSQKKISTQNLKITHQEKKQCSVIFYLIYSVSIVILFRSIY